MKRSYPDLSIIFIGHVDHGKTTLAKAITGKWLDTYKEEQQRGITIRLGYVDFDIYEDPTKEGFERFTTKPCENCKHLRKISVVDAPGHESLIIVMLSGAALVDAAVLVIAANEKVPQPQTEEHLKAAEIIGIKNFIIVQNKIDLVTKEQAIENYKQIKEFIKGTNAENSPIIPVSAVYGINVDALLYALTKIPIPKKEINKDPLMVVARSFDVNKPGTDPEKLIGGVLGGSLKQGKLRVGDEIEIRPGIQMDNEWYPLTTEIVSIHQGGHKVKEALPRGTVAIGTKLDPFLTREDNLAGQVVGLPGKLPPEWEEVELEINLFEKAIGTNVKVERLKKGDKILVGALSIVSPGVVLESKKNRIYVRLAKPIVLNEGERVVLAGKINNRWRIIGYGNLVGGKEYNI